MTTPISGTSFADVMVQQQKPASAGQQELGKDVFLKLLVAQLKYQNPLDPQDGSEFLAQSAQFTMVEKLQELATQGAEMRTLASAGLVGRTVTYTDADSATQTGVVERVKQTTTGTVLVVDGQDVPLATVTEVTTTAPTPAAATTPPPAAPTTPTTPSTDAHDSDATA